MSDEDGTNVSGDSIDEGAALQLSTPADYRRAVIALLNNARLSVDVFSSDLNPVIFGNPELIAAVRGFVLRSKHGLLRVLIRDTGPLTRDDHRFSDLVQRISSKIRVRVLSANFHSRDDAFVIADDAHYALRNRATAWTGIYDVSRPEVGRQLRTAFDEMWEHSLPDPGVRRLHI